MRYVKLTEVCKLLSGFAWSASKFNSNNCGVPIIRIQNVDSKNEKEFLYWDHEYNEKFVINSGDLLLTLSGSFRVVEWSGPRALLNQRIVKLIPNENKISRSWLLHSLKSKLLQIEQMGKHALVNNVSLEDLQKLALYLPPLPEQKRIADILDRADELRTKRRQAIEHLNELKKSIFLEMFGDPVTNPYNFPFRILQTLYVDKKNGTKCGPFGSALRKNEYQKFGIPVWNMDNISKKTNFIDEPNLWISENKYQELISYAAQEGDVIISRAGTVGKMCVLRSKYNKSIISTNLIRVRFNKELLPDYFVSLMSFCKDRVSRLKTGTDDAFTYMNTGILDNIKFPCPPIFLQLKYLERIIKIDSIKKTHLKNKNYIDDLFSSLQDRAFKGELSKNDSLESILKNHAKNQNKQSESQL